MKSLISQISHMPLFLIPEESYETRNWKTFTMPVHRHGCLEINYILDGECIYQVEGEHYHLKKKSLILFDSLKPHKLEFIRETPGAVLGMSFVRKSSDIGQAAGQGNSEIMNRFFDRKRVLVLENARSVLPAMQDIASEFSLDADTFYLNLLSVKLLFEVARFSQLGNSTQRMHVKKIETYIQENYSSITCIDNIATYVGLNKTYMERIFKAHSGITIWNYLKNVRMKHAVYLLRNTDIPIGDIDELIGIHSRQSFYLIFQKQFGMSPQNYRKFTRNEL